MERTLLESVQLARSLQVFVHLHERSAQSSTALKHCVQSPHTSRLSSASTSYKPQTYLASHGTTGGCLTEDT